MTNSPSTEGVLKLAAEKEAEAGRFYADAADMAENPGAKALLLQLAEQEQGHQERLERLEPSAIGDLGEGQVQSLRISEFLTDKPLQAEATFQEVMVYAMKREERAEGFFNGLAEAMPAGDLKHLFGMLAREESKHKAVLEKLYDEVIYKEN